MKIIVGLGNPGKKYENTRHNAGFIAIDNYLQGKEVIKCQSKFHGQICEMHFHATKTFLIKPQSFMNNSGEVVKEICNFYKVEFMKDLLIIHDEVDLKFGYYKLAYDSGPAGHNGIKSIIEQLNTNSFHRLRIGIETRLSRHESPTESFVLSPFSETELHTLKKNILPKINEEINKFITSK